MEKILLMTGASSDIADVLLRSIANRYKIIYLLYNTENEKFIKLVEDIGKHTIVEKIKCNLLNNSDVDNVVNVIKNSNKLPNNIIHLAAAKIYNLQFHKENVENFNLSWKISIEAFIKLLMPFIKPMCNEHYGRIIFMLSKNTIDVPPKFQSCYTTIKYALLGLMKSLYIDYYEKGIMVNAISPNMIKTKFIENIPDIILDKVEHERDKNGMLTINELIPTFEKLLSDELNTSGENILIN